MLPPTHEAVFFMWKRPICPCHSMLTPFKKETAPGSAELYVSLLPGDTARARTPVLHELSATFALK